MNKLYLLFVVLCFAACQQAIDKPIVEASATIKENSTMETKPALVHTVFFWTKEGTTADQHKAFEKGLEKLGTCPQIKTFYWGQPATTEKRDVVDNSYDYAINVHFTSLDDQAEYQTEPIHLAFIEDHKDIWDKVVVYDNKVN